MEDLISVIVPVFNSEKFLDRCINSIINQTYKNLEIILVDDGSTDNSGKICDDYAIKDKRIKVIHKKNGGASSARNAGIDLSKGKYIGFVDSDDWIEKDTYEILYNLIEKYSTKIVCCGRFDVDSKTGIRQIGLCPTEEKIITAEEMLADIFTWNNCDLSPCDKLFDATLFTENRFPDGMVCEDVGIMYKIISEAEKVLICDIPLYNYYHHNNSVTTSKFSEKTFHFSIHTEKIVNYIKQHHPNIIEYALYFRIKSIIYSITSIAKQKKEIFNKYKDEYDKYLKELYSYRKFCFKSKFFNFREKILLILLYFRVYRFLSIVKNRFNS